MSLRILRISVGLAAIMFISQSCAEYPPEDISYQPMVLKDGWPVSTPEEQGLDVSTLDAVYKNAEQLDNIYSLLIVKNGYLIGERYFNGQNAFMANPTASVTNGVTSALAGIALRENYISGLDQKMMEFFPEIARQTLDSRKSGITIRHILQMRSGYPWEEFNGYLMILFSSSQWIPFLQEFPLTGDPGTRFGYSNLTTHIMGIIIARAAHTSLLSFAKTYLFNPLNIAAPCWPVDSVGYYYGDGDICLTPRNMAKIGQLYLKNGVYNGVQIIPAEWISASLRTYSPTTYSTEIFTNIHRLGYGYLWWSGESGNHHYNFAWGNGGQSIMIIQDLNMVIVTTAAQQSVLGDVAWQKTKAVMELVGGFICRI